MTQPLSGAPSTSRKKLDWPLVFVLVAVLMPLAVVPIPWTYRVSLLVLATASFAFPAWLRALVLAACGYVAFAALAPAWMLPVAFGLCALALLLSKQWAVGFAAAMILGALVIVYAVLRRSDWPVEADLLWRAAQGLAACMAAWICCAALGQSRVIQRAGFVALGLLLVGFVGAQGDMQLPASRLFATRLAQPPYTLTAFDRPEQVADLERLWAAGYADAAYLLARLAYAQNAGPQTLRELCPKATHRSILPTGWDVLVAEGEQLCEAVRGWPEAGMAKLLQAGHAMTLRLQADLALEAGDIGAAQRLFEQAKSQDPQASLAALVGMQVRNRSEEGAALAQPEDPRQALLLGHPASETTWQGYNALLDFDSLAPGERRGLRVIDEPGSTTTVFEPSLGRRSLVTRSRYGLSFALALPLPPEKQVPSRLRFWGRSVRAIRLTVANEAGQSVTYTCDGNANYRPLPTAMCRGEWAEAVLPLADDLAGPLESMVLRGDLRVARLLAEP